MRGSPVSPDFGVLARSNDELRRVIWAAWRPGSGRGGEGSERRVRGTYRRGLDGHYS
jgi:hypothetical protein